MRLAIAIVLLLLAGCATVAPYERELLSPKRMQLSADPLAAEMSEHVHEYREGVAGGFGGGGGGCGCN
jgi:hypothetical protein